MKISAQSTEYVLLNARTNSQWDICNFAIVSISEEWKNELQKRFALIEPFSTDPMFTSTSYYDTGVEFYRDDDKLMPDSSELLNGKEWSFIITDEEETQELLSPENALDCHELVVNADGTAYYKAYGKHTGEEFWTAHFSIQTLLEYLNANHF